MALEITLQNGAYEISGDFTGINNHKVKAHFNYLLDHYQEVVLCLKKVSKIDKRGIKVLQIIHKKATKRSKTLFVLGKENEYISSLLAQTENLHIFRNDY